MFHRIGGATTKLGNRSLGYFVLRICLGMNIAMHGISRLLSGPALFAAGLHKQFADTFLPVWSVSAFGLSLPWIESALGLLILFGLFTRAALFCGGLLMALLTFGVALVQQWDVAGIQLIYGAVFAFLLFLLDENRLSLDDARINKAVYSWNQERGSSGFEHGEHNAEQAGITNT